MREMMLLRACPRCGGDLYVTEDVYGSFHQCMQCGHIQDVLDEGVTASVKRPAAKAKDNVAA